MWNVGWAIFCAPFAVWDFIKGAQTGRWWDYALGVWMTALTAFYIYLARKKKDKPVSINPYNNPGYALGGYTAPRAYLTTSKTPAIPQKPAAREFAGLPFDFAVGEVYGLRMWRMDQYGRLRARNWDTAEPWRPGVNVAKCVKREEPDYLRAYSRLMGQPTPSEPAPKPPHDTPSESCACGFYAYTDSRHADTVAYKRDGFNVILGIVKGTGRTLLGTQGFRCEKAEIIALRDPTRGGTKTDPWRLQQLANLKRVYPDVPLLESREALLEFAPLTETLPDPSTDEFWSLP